MNYLRPGNHIFLKKQKSSANLAFPKSKKEHYFFTFFEKTLKKLPFYTKTVSFKKKDFYKKVSLFYAA